MTTTYKATAELDDANWWIITVDGVGVTQARSVREAEEMAIDLVYAMTDEEGADVDITFSGGPFDEIEPLRRKQEVAETLMAEASTDMRALVAKLLEVGLHKADVARVLKVSPQRVSQLSAEVRPATVKAKTSMPRPRVTTKDQGPDKSQARKTRASA